MDNRLTKRRLSDFLAYEWILTIVAAVAAIIVLELIYTVAATRLSTGQQFKFYFDDMIFSGSSDKTVYDLLGVEYGENGKTFSYDVLSVETESLTSSYNVLSVRLSVQEGDAIFTSSLADEEDGGVKAKEIADSYAVYDFSELAKNAETYLKNFLIDKENGDVYDLNAYDENAIRAYFDARMKGDKRFRSEAAKEEGRINEIGRIKKLAADLKDFNTLLSVGDGMDLFFRYVRYEQASGGDTADKDYGKVYEREKEKGEKIYGINVAALTGGGKTVSEYVKISGEGVTSAEGVVLMLFDFSGDQYDLQFESISFTVTLAREFGNVL